MQETQIQSPGWKDPLEKEMATTHISILAWEIPRTKEFDGLYSTGVTKASDNLVAK